MNNSANSQEIQGRIQIRTKQKLRKLIESYYFSKFSTEFDIGQLHMFYQNIANSEIKIISKYKIREENTFFNKYICTTFL